MPDDIPPAIPPTPGPGSLADARDGSGATVITPLDVDGVRAIGIGTLLWGLALVGCVLARGRLEASGASWWIGVCLAGFLLGLPGLWFLRHRRARHEASTSES